MIRRYVFLGLAVAFLWTPVAQAQFGGRPGDAVIYVLTYRGSGQLQVVPSGTTNDPRATAAFRTVDVSTVPLVPGTPFPLFRQILFEQSDELFQVGSDFEGTVGIHRVFLVPVKILQIGGGVTLGIGLGVPNNYITVPQGIDLVGDIAIETVKIITWAPTAFPFMTPTDRPGPLVPPGMTGYQYLLGTPGLILLPGLMPWNNMRRLQPGAGWPDGVDSKLLDLDPVVGNTTRMLRLRPGRVTPPFRIPGTTHLYVLQGSVDITPANSNPVTLKQNHYAFIPGNFVISISNPRPYDGPGAP